MTKAKHKSLYHELDTFTLISMIEGNHLNCFQYRDIMEELTARSYDRDLGAFQFLVSSMAA